MVAGPAPAGLIAPAAILELVGDRPWRAVWLNESGGVTFRIGAGDGTEFVKWSPRSSGVDPCAEVARLRWAAPFLTVPRVLGARETLDGSLLRLSPIDGESAVSDRWSAEPAPAVSAIGRGLRRLHDALPVEDCPFSWTVEARLARSSTGVRSGPWHEIHGDLSIDDALERLADPPSIDKLVVCHGDACAPNTILTPDGDVAGHVDLGALGIADRWADLAIATWSTGWNYGPGWEGHLLDAYGIDPDPDRTAYYRLLWDVSS